MDEHFIRTRITALRMKKGVSEYRMSTDMGRSKSYIQGITSGRSLPSMSEFLYMCEYFNISPHEFFNEAVDDPALLHETIKALRTLSEEDIALTLKNITRLQRR